MKIQSIRLQNFKMFRKVAIGDLPPLAVFVGANGSGKSTLFDVFGFLRDALTYNVEVALNMKNRGGFGEMRTREETGPIKIELKFRAVVKGRERLVAYAMVIGLRDGTPIIEKETLSYKRDENGPAFKFLDFKRGKGRAVADQDFSVADDKLVHERQSLDARIPALKGLGQFDKFEAASKFRQFIENWHLSDFHLGAARSSPGPGCAERLSESGDNLALAAKFMAENHPKKFRVVLEKMRRHIPGVVAVETETMLDGRVLLKFRDGAWKDPFIASRVSDGAVKMFAYLVLLNASAPHPLLCVEEPENHIYPSLLGELLEEFRLYARQSGEQVFVSTHSSDLLNKAEVDEAFWLEKINGLTEVHRARDHKLLGRLKESGDVLGDLWRMGLFGRVNPDRCVA